MEPKFDLLATSKRNRLSVFDTNFCIFCSKPFSIKCPASHPDLSKLDNLLKACQERQDNIGKIILENSSDILSGQESIAYHKNCRSSYCSPYHVKRFVAKRSNEESMGGGSHGHGDGDVHNTENASTSHLLTRSSTSTFDWKNNCFVCGERCNPKHRSTWSMVEVAIHNKPGDQNMYTKMLLAAEKRRDQVMLNRLHGVANGDLVAVEARYHRQKSCYSHYISEKHITIRQQLSDDSPYKCIIRKLLNEFQPAILEEKKVFTLKTLLSRFRVLASEHGLDNPEAYKSSNLKKQLMQECPDIAFIAQPGMSDLVCDSTITVGDALKKISELVSTLGNDSEEQLTTHNEFDINEESLVHTAVGILRRRIETRQSQTRNDTYASSDDMTMAALKNFVDPLLYKAIGWLTNKDLFLGAMDINEQNTMKSLSITCDIMTLASNVFSPKHLGLAIHLHHEFGSRKLVEHLSYLGHCVSYGELRRFLTSAAVHVSNTQTTASGCFVPRELQTREKGGKLIIGVGDNWDHNERTVDGKRTTHAMTSILVSPKSDSDAPAQTIPRIADRSLNIELMPGTVYMLLSIMTFMFLRIRLNLESQLACWVL